MSLGDKSNEIEAPKNVKEGPKKEKGADVFESPEAVEEKMIRDSEKEVSSFKEAGEAKIKNVETQAVKDGLEIDLADKSQLEGLNQEAEGAKNELVNKITPPPLPEEYVRQHVATPPPLPEEYIKKHSAVPPPLPNMPPPIPDSGVDNVNNKSQMQERVVKKAELLSKEEASRKFLAEERAKLIEEIRAEIEKSNLSPENLDASKEDEQYGRLAEMQSDEANAMAERFSSGDVLSEKDAEEEQENLEQLIANSQGLEEIKKKIEEHYAKADEVAKEKFESMRKTVEQTMLRNNAFIVHTFLTDERLRHNANSNISQRATLEDDIDILLSLEPSVSSSSVIPGIRQGLWGNNVGVVFGGGDIRGVARGDDGTVPEGVDGRNGTISTSEEIDSAVSDKKERGYNELVVNNPKVFGFFQNVDIDQSGKMLGFNPKYRKKDDFMQNMNLAKEKGMPLLIMTPDRKLFEFIDIADNGIVSVGKEITPEQVAIGNVGLDNEKRKEIGDNVISKNLFKKIADQKEAKRKVAGLAGQEVADMELSKEEYLNYIKSETNVPLRDFPINLLSDKDFMIEAAKYYLNPNTIYAYAGDNLKRDIDFIRHMYEVAKGKIYSSIPKDIRNNEEIVSLAIENDDILNNLDVSLAESPIIWEKIINSLIEKKDSRDWDYLRDVGESKVLDADFAQFLMEKEDGYGSSEFDMTKKVLTDGGFIQKLNKKYPKFKFEINDSDHVKVTRIAE